MANILDYIKISYPAASITNIYTNGKDFALKYDQIKDIERKSYIRHYIIHNTPFAFSDKPLLFEQITQYLADELEINPAEIKLIGSAKTGFSMGSNFDYGKEWGPNRDLDFSLINLGLFETLENEFRKWEKLYEEEKILPLNNKEHIYWPQNIENINKTIERGFIDTYKIPNREPLWLNMKINNTLSIVETNLNLRKDFIIKESSARVYRSWAAFSGQLKRNTEAALASIKK